MDCSLANTARAKLGQVDRDDVVRLRAAHDDRARYRCQRIPVASRRERCEAVIDIVNIVERTTCTSIANSSPGLD